MTQNGSKIDQKRPKAKVDSKMNPKMNPKWIQNGPKIDLKWNQNVVKRNYLSDFQLVCDLDALFRLQIPFLTSSDVVNGRQEEEIMEDWWYSEPDT